LLCNDKKYLFLKHRLKSIYFKNYHPIDVYIDVFLFCFLSDVYKIIYTNKCQKYII